MVFKDQASQADALCGASPFVSVTRMKSLMSFLAASSDVLSGTHNLYFCAAIVGTSMNAHLEILASFVL